MAHGIAAQGFRWIGMAGSGDTTGTSHAPKGFAPHLALLLICCLFTVLTHAQSLQLDLDAISGTGWSARKVQLVLAIGGAAKLDLKGLSAQGRDLGDVSIACARFAFENRVLQCEDGHLQGAVHWPLSFSYDLARKTLRLSITPEKDETWQLDIAAGGG